MKFKFSKISIYLIGSFITVFCFYPNQLLNLVVFGFISLIDICIILVYVHRRISRTDLTDNNPIEFLDVLRENDNPKNPVPTVVERRFVGENKESEDNGNDREIGRA